MAEAKKSRARSSDAAGAADAFTAEERAAMKERAREVRATGRRRDTAAEDEAAVLAKIAELDDADRALATRLHAVITTSAPSLRPKLWYGMPAYAKDGKVVCFFQGAAKFKTRYSTLGFSDLALLDDGAVWPTSYAVTTLGKAEEKRIAELVARAVGD
jgi:uncharacterized protein YdhG (YjbR/CyaY superfamily)